MNVVRSLYCGLLLPAFCMGIVPCAVCSGHARQQGPEQSATVTLTSDHPAASFAIAPETLSSALPVVVIRVTKVVNPGRAPFQIFVYLSYRSALRHEEAEKIPIGNVGLFPADRPAAFLLRASNAFAQLKASASTAVDVRLFVEMKPLHKTDRLTALEVTVAPPEWKAEPRR